MNADPKFDATVHRHALVALEHRVLYFPDRVVRRDDHAAKRDDRAIAVSDVAGRDLMESREPVTPLPAAR
jgi:hypothetical protein